MLKRTGSPVLFCINHKSDMTQDIKLIFLTGFMGAGKTTVARILADKLQWVYIDLDDVLVSNEQKSISDIFTENGEEYFRDCESSLLNSQMFERASVVATGGGIVARKINRDRMKALGKIVYLKTSWNELKSRLASSTDRPLVDQNNGWTSVEKLWAERQPYYEDCDIIVETDGLKPAEIVTSIMKQLPGN